MHLETGALDLAKLFELPDQSYNDQNYIDGKLVNCFEGFCKQLLSKIWNVFHEPLFVKRLYDTPAESLANPLAVQIYQQDFVIFLSLVKKHALSQLSKDMLSINASDSLLQLDQVDQRTE